MSSGEFKKVPMLLTFCRDEGLIFHSAVYLLKQHLFNDINDNWEHVAPITFWYDEDPNLKYDKETIARKIKKFYFNNEPVSHSTFQNLTDVYTDAWFYRGIRDTALIMGKHTDVYLAVINHESKTLSTSQLVGTPGVYGK